jgi:hypothetical protein
MKANEVPEKIYLQEPTKVRTEKKYDNDVEYIRIDAFIEKALAYLNSKFYFHNAFYGVVSTDFNAMEELFEDFKNYMKGE